MVRLTRLVGLDGVAGVVGNVHIRSGPNITAHLTCGPHHILLVSACALPRHVSEGGWGCWLP